jgi:hypothetical protein
MTSPHPFWAMPPDAWFVNPRINWEGLKAEHFASLLGLGRLVGPSYAARVAKLQRDMSRSLRATLLLGLQRHQQLTRGPRSTIVHRPESTGTSFVVELFRARLV